MTPTDAVTTVELVGGTKGPVTLDADKNIVLLIKNNTQSVKVTSTKDGSSVTKTYALTNLTWNPNHPNPKAGLSSPRAPLSFYF